MMTVDSSDDNINDEVDNCLDDRQRWRMLLRIESEVGIDMSAATTMLMSEMLRRHRYN